MLKSAPFFTPLDKAIASTDGSYKQEQEMNLITIFDWYWQNERNYTDQNTCYFIKEGLGNFSDIEDKESVYFMKVVGAKLAHFICH